jgi:hypothetical protein
MVPRHWLAVLAASLPLVAGACADRSSTPTGPRESLSVVPVSTPTCSFSNAKSLANSEFQVAAQKQAAKDSVDAMQTGGAFSARARTAGFSIMARIAAAKKANTAKDAATGSDLTNALIPCMFDPSSTDFPAGYPIDFTPALDRSQPGAYDVRSPTGGPNSGTGAVLTFPGATNNLARISSFESITGNWNDVLGQTVLIYGLPIAITGGFDPDQYEWKTISPNVTFQTSQAGPGVIVGLCNTSNVSDQDLMNETEVGFLTFVQSPPGCTAAFAQLETTWGPRLLVDALKHFGSGLLSPEPAYASSMFFATTIGGTAKGGKSKYTKQKLDPNVAAIQFTFSGVTGTTVGKPMSPDPQIQATFQGTPVSNVVLTIGGITNNGTPTQVLCGTPASSPCQVTIPYGGTATIPNVTVTKSGALQLVVIAASIPDRPGIAFAIGTRSIKVIIKPK